MALSLALQSDSTSHGLRVKGFLTAESPFLQRLSSWKAKSLLVAYSGIETSGLEPAAEGAMDVMKAKPFSLADLFCKSLSVQ